MGKFAAPHSQHFLILILGTGWDGYAEDAAAAYCKFACGEKVCARYPVEDKQLITNVDRLRFGASERASSHVCACVCVFVIAIKLIHHAEKYSDAWLADRF